MADFYDDVLNDGEPSATPDAGEKDVLSAGRIKLEQQIKALQDSLERRSQLPFDPMMMSVAAGLLKPTQTGSFGESLGYAAENAVTAGEKERARRSELEKMKLDLALKQYELAGDVEGQRLLGQMMTGQAPTIGGPKAQPRGGAPVSGAPMEGAPAEGGPKQDLSVKETVELVKQNPSALNKVTLSPEKVAAIYRVSPKYGTIAQKMLENQTKVARLEQEEEQLGLRRKEIGTKSVPVVSPYDADREMKMSADKYEEYLKLDFSDNRAVNTWLRKNGLGAFAIGKENAPVENAPTATAGAPAGETKAEKEQRVAREQEKYKADIDQHKKNVEVLNNRSDAAIDIRNNAKSVYNYASNPKTRNAFGVLAKPGVIPAIASAAEQGIKVGDYSVGIAGVTDTVRKIGGTQAEIDAADAVSRNISQLELGFSQTFKGQGQVSDNERLIVRQVGPKLADSPKVAMLKSESIIARADFDSKNQELFDKWQRANPSGLYGQYKSSPQYKGLVDSYDNKLGQILSKYGMNPAKKSESGTSYYQRLKQEGNQ